MFIFATDVFHPLLSPLTTATFSSGSNTPVGEEDGKLPPGGFNIRHAFPHWPLSLSQSSQKGADGPAAVNDKHAAAVANNDVDKVNIVDALVYVRSCFQDEERIDSIPLEAAVNPGAWYAWRSHRSKVRPDLAVQKSPSISADKRRSGELTRPKGPSEWNWEGVWQERVKRAVQFTLTELSLYGTAGSAGREDEIQFVKADSDQLEQMQS